MNKRYIVTEEIESPNRITKSLEAFDFFFVLGYMAISFGFMFLVHEKLRILFMIFSLLIAIFLTSKSPFNKHRRNYESLLIMSKVDISVYRPFIKE